MLSVNRSDSLIRDFSSSYYIPLPLAVAIQRPRRRDNAWLRIWTDKTILSPSSSSSSSPSQPTHDDRNNSEQLVSKERLSGEPVSHLLAIEAELDVLCASLGAVPPADAESVEAIDEARREVMLAAWRRRATETTTGLCWCVPYSRICMCFLAGKSGCGDFL